MIPLSSPSGPISNSSSSDSNSVTDKESKDKDKDSKGEKSARDRSAQQPAGKIHQISQISIFLYSSPVDAAISVRFAYIDKRSHFIGGPVER